MLLQEQDMAPDCLADVNISVVPAEGAYLLERERGRDRERKRIVTTGPMSTKLLNSPPSPSAVTLCSANSTLGHAVSLVSLEE
jgi:hypothetical protein